MNMYQMILDEYEKRNQIIIENLVLHLGNNIMTDYNSRKLLINSGIHDRIAQIVSGERIHEGVVKNSVWYLGLALKYKPEMDEQRISKALEVCLKFLESEDPEVENDALWGLCNASETDFDSILELYVTSNVCGYIVNSDRLRQKTLVIPVVRLFGNLLSNEPRIVDYLIAVGCIPFLQKFLYHKSSNVRKETLWAISNIGAGTLDQIKDVIQADIVPTVLSLFKDEDIETVREAVYTISNLINGGNFETCSKLVDSGMLPAILYILRSTKNPEILKLALASLDVFFRHGTNHNYMSEDNPFVRLFEEQGGPELLEHLQFYKNDDIFELVEELLSKFFHIQVVAK
jgi:importin subunit alpha-1